MHFLKELFEEQVIPLSLLVDPQTYVSRSIKRILFLDLVHEISKNQFYVFFKFLCALNGSSILYFIILYFIFSRHLSYIFYFFFLQIQIKRKPQNIS